MKDLILGRVEDFIVDLLYYDRGDDEELPVGEIEKAIKEGVITVDEIVEKFKTSLEEGLG